MTVIASMKPFENTLQSYGQELRRSTTRILQVNLGKLCNLTCSHCHVNAGPGRKENMDRATLDRILDWFEASAVQTIDFTGGAPEMNPGFKDAIVRIRSMALQRRIIDRCNLTILLEPGFDELSEFLALHEVELIASMPCYQPDNVNAQRGEGVFDSSIRALQILNELGYGHSDNLPLHLVYNPIGPFLPAPQAGLESDFKKAMSEHFGVVFNRLYTITNMPIARFASWLKNNGELASYNELLVNAFNPETVGGLMCRDTLSVDWEGGVYDCDFNQMLGLRMGGREYRRLWEIEVSQVAGAAIQVADHCYGCTAGSGSSCGGAIEGEKDSQAQYC